MLLLHIGNIRSLAEGKNRNRSTDEADSAWLRKAEKKLRLPGLEQTERKAERQSEGATNALILIQKLCQSQPIPGFMIVRR